MDAGAAGRSGMLHHYNFYANVALGILLLAGWVWPRLGGRWLGAIEARGSQAARHKTACVGGVALLLLLLRLASWPSDGIPIPYVPDEFSYLLAGDTFAHGRLANPAHPMRLFFETIHVNMSPAYVSKYPPAQGAVLAAGELLGHPWIGVLLSMAAMCAALTWMMQGWLPARWALLGGILAVTRFYAYNDWVDSYWGGAAAAIGGALALGALPRLMRTAEWRQGMILGAGVAILANSRPYEGMIFCLPVAGALAWWLARGRAAQGAGPRLRIMASAGGVLLVCAAFMAYYNWRGTGSPLVLPYQVNDRTYLTTPHFIWQQIEPPRHYRNPQLDDLYNRWCREVWQKAQTPTLTSFARAAWRKLEALQEFYLPGGFFLAPVVTLPWLLRNRKARYLLLVCACTVLGLLAVVWFQAHYAAPMTAAALAVSMMGLRYLRTLGWRGKPYGVGLSRAVVLAQVLSVYASLAGFGAEYRVPHPLPGWARDRQRMGAQLEAMPGQQLVLVRYGAQHDSTHEWVYNRAEIDQSKVVWAREIPGEDLRPLLEYFHGRQVWTVAADANPATLEAYSPSPRP